MICLFCSHRESLETDSTEASDGEPQRINLYIFASCKISWKYYHKITLVKRGSSVSYLSFWLPAATNDILKNTNYINLCQGVWIRLFMMKDASTAFCVFQLLIACKSYNKLSHVVEIDDFCGLMNSLRFSVTSANHFLLYCKLFIAAHKVT